ncbi:LTA synthase family protein [Clostridium mediterraneense]|uniref:LTA synthase family protein n=1 Tax=Clostridium mediterraneense TaxID=1805472 RepID=UPI0008313077|nr:LTA synthase family protein [Clostridium mediterraneense]
MRIKKSKFNLSRNQQSKQKKILKPIIYWLSLTLIFTIIIELLQRASIIKTITFILGSFSLFLLNYFIFLSATSIAFLFKKTKSVYAIIAGIIMIFSIGGAVIMKFRGSPLTAADLYSIKDGLSIAQEYLNVFQMILIGIVLIALIVLIVFCFKREKKNEGFSYKRNIALIIIPTILLTFGIYKYNDIQKKIKIYRWDLTSTYSNNGFLVSFINSSFELIPQKPESYNEARMNEIKDKLDSATATVSNTKVKPNIIVVQLESFVDPYRLKGVKFEEDPIPNIRKLSQQGPNGLITVPSFGGGTVRTEFEVLTGYCANNLGPGEIPNNTVLKKQSVESLAYILKKQGYQTTAIHDYLGNFYNRDTVYSNFGFDNLVTMEYMDDLKYTYNYPSDMNNLASIEQVLSRKEPQFIFNVAVESHGPYDKSYNAKKYTVSGNISNEDRNQIQEYVDKAHEVDKYVKALIDYVEKSGEPTIIAMYGDHLPALSVINNKDIFPQDEKYKPEYFIWSNIGVKPKEQDISAYQLSTYILNLAGIDGAIMPTFHKMYSQDANYMDYLKDVQYDQLYGKDYLEGTDLYKKSDLQLGLNPITITKAYIQGKQLVVEGDNLTKASKVIVDGKQLQTTYESKNKIVATGFKDNIKEVKVGQVGMYDKVLSETEKIKVTKQ